MALTYDDITSKTNAFIIPRIVDSFYKSGPLLTRLRTKNQEKFEGGTKIRQPIMYAPLKGGAFTRGGTFDTSYVQTDTAMEFNVKYYYVNSTLFGTDNVLNRGPEAAMSYVETKLVNAAERMGQLLGTDLYLDGQGTNSQVIQLDGLQSAIDDGTTYTSYGGITRANISSADNTGINSYVAASVGVLSLSAIQTAFGSCWFGNEHIDLMPCTQSIWDIVEAKVQPQQRYYEEDTDVAKIGFRALRFKGASLVVDQYAPTGVLWFLNTKYISFWLSTLPLWQFGFTGWKEAQGTVDVSGQYLFAGNIVVSAPRLMGQMNGITG